MVNLSPIVWKTGWGFSPSVAICRQKNVLWLRERGCRPGDAPMRPSCGYTGEIWFTVGLFPGTTTWRWLRLDYSALGRRNLVERSTLQKCISADSTNSFGCKIACKCTSVFVDVLYCASIPYVCGKNLGDESNSALGEGFPITLSDFGRGKIWMDHPDCYHNEAAIPTIRFRAEKLLTRPSLLS